MDDGSCYPSFDSQQRCERLNVWTTLLFCPNCHGGFQLRHVQTRKRTNNRIDSGHVFREGRAAFSLEIVITHPGVEYTTFLLRIALVRPFSNIQRKTFKRHVLAAKFGAWSVRGGDDPAN